MLFCQCRQFCSCLAHQWYNIDTKMNPCPVNWVFPRRSCWKLSLMLLVKEHLLYTEVIRRRFPNAHIHKKVTSHGYA